MTDFLKMLGSVIFCVITGEQFIERLRQVDSELAYGHWSKE